MTFPEMVGLAFAALGVGGLVGAVGIGGVLLIPAFVFLAGISVHQAIATALCTFVATGLVGTVLFQRRGSIDWRITVPVCLGALVFGFVGAYVSAGVHPKILSVIVAILLGFAGSYTLFAPHGRGNPALERYPTRQWFMLVVIGAFVGFGSGLTGAGGPLFLVPALVLLGFAPLQTIGAGQVIQVLAASSATVGNLRYGSIDLAVAAAATIFEVIGVAIGVSVVHAVDVATVRKFVAWLCIVTGTVMLIRTVG